MQTQVLALTITEHANATDVMKQKFELLNALIAKYEKEGFYSADIAKAIPWTELDEAERRRIWEYAFSVSLPLCGPVSGARAIFRRHPASMSCSHVSPDGLKISWEPKANYEIPRSDGVHLTRKGYELMGNVISDRLIGIIKEQKAPGMLQLMPLKAVL